MLYPCAKTIHGYQCSYPIPHDSIIEEIKQERETTNSVQLKDPLDFTQPFFKKCTFKALLKTDLHDHRKHHHQNETIYQRKKTKEYKCQSCKSRTNSKYLYISHWRNCPANNFKTHCKNLYQNIGTCSEYQCDLCHFRTTKKYNLPKHLNTVHFPVLKFVCPHCNYRAKRAEHVRRHVQSHHSASAETRFTCTACSFSTKIFDNLRRHILKRHTQSNQTRETPHQCNLCTYRTTTTTRLVRHKRAIHFSLKYNCQLCDYKTKKAEYLQSHVLLKHASNDLGGVAQWYPCGQCGYKTPRKYQLKKHVEKWHTGEQRSCKCEHCEFEAADEASVRKHVRIAHVEVKQCELCAYKTNRKERLVNHVLQRHSRGAGQTFECDQCDYKGKLRERLICHIRFMHAKVADFCPCSQCGYVGKNSYYLKRHVENMHMAEEDKLQCPNCSYRSNRRYMNRHRGRVHREFSKVIEKVV